MKNLNTLAPNFLSRRLSLLLLSYFIHPYLLLSLSFNHTHSHTLTFTHMLTLTLSHALSLTHGHNTHTLARRPLVTHTTPPPLTFLIPLKPNQSFSLSLSLSFSPFSSNVSIFLSAFSFTYDTLVVFLILSHFFCIPFISLTID